MFNISNNRWFLGWFFVFFIFYICKIQGEENIDVATYKDVYDVPNHPEQYLIDLRTIDRIEVDGSIPSSLIIPFAELENALEMDNEEFQSKYGREVPPKDALIIFICLGYRQWAQMASDLARDKGWKRSKPYLGSWLEWTEGQKWE